MLRYGLLRVFGCQALHPGTLGAKGHAPEAGGIAQEAGLHCPDKSERLYLLPLMRTALRRPSRQAGEGGQTHCETDALKGPSTMKGLAFWKGPDWLRFVGQALQYARESAAAAPFCVA
jgi:hypothetical protein